VTAALALAASPAVSADEPAPPSGVLLIAHRGSSDKAPEHTLGAIDQAVADRADRLSIDVHLTRDGVPVVIHDRYLSRTTDVERVFPSRSPWLISDFTLAELTRLDTGSWYPGGAYTGSRLLTLDQVLTELADSPTGLTVEAKNPAFHGGVPRMGKAIMDVVGAHPEWRSTVSESNPRLVIESFEWDFLDGMHDAYPDQPLVLLGDVTPEDMTARPYVREIDVRYPALTEAVVAAARQFGMLVGTWTPNAAGDIERVLKTGAQAVTTDQPDDLRDMLRTSGQTWTGITWPVAPATARVDVTVPATAPVGGRVTVQARPAAADGTRLRWQDVDFWARLDGVWRKVSSNATDSHGTAVSSLLVHENNMRVRVVSGGRTSTERGVAAVTQAVVLPAGAPAPSLRMAAQSSPTTSGADPRVTRLSTATWNAMAGRSWRRGCPVGRSALRTLRVSYWGFDGHRHRGEIVVARGSAAQLGRVFTRLYAQRLPVRSLRRVETMGTGFTSARDRALRSGSSFGYACQRMPGDGQKAGSHARGTVVAVNPWENPTRIGSGGTPDTWWLSRSRTTTYVHRSTSAVVRAFKAEGFAWAGKYGKYADFRDVR
jgi:glycerophosphoryl diester phosphodiesterase